MCGSKNVTVTVMNEQSYSIGKGVAGTLLFGPGGAAMGVNGKSEEKKKYVCQACGEISPICMAQNMSKQIDEEIAKGDSIFLPSLKSSYPNIEWEPRQETREEEKEKTFDFSKLITEIDRDILVDLITEIGEPITLIDLRRQLAERMGVDEDNIATFTVSSRIRDLAEDFGVVRIPVKKTSYYTTIYGYTYYVETLIEHIKDTQRDISKSEKQMLLLAYDNVLEQCDSEKKEEIMGKFNQLQELMKICEEYDAVADLMSKNTIPDYQKAIDLLSKGLVPNHWKDSEDLLAKCQQNLENLKEAKLKTSRKENGLCPYCGGNFKGFFTRSCAQCGRKKDY
jgi:DNA-binding transcriptional regulator GbsR (MarR family)